MNVLGKPTYLCSLKAQPGQLFTLSCAIKAIQLKPECYLSSVICLPKVKVLYGSFLYCFVFRISMVSVLTFFHLINQFQKWVSQQMFGCFLFSFEIKNGGVFSKVCHTSFHRLEKVFFLSVGIKLFLQSIDSKAW